MEWKDVKQYLEQNKDSAEVQEYLRKNAPVTLDAIKEAVKNDEEARKWLQAEKDRAVTKGIETWKEKTLPSVLEEEIKKRFPDETPEQKELRRLREELEKERQERIRADLKAKAKEYAVSKKLPASLVDFFIGQDEETTMANLEALEQTWTEAVKEVKESVFKQNGRTPHPGDPAGKPAVTKEQFDKMNYLERLKLAKEQPELYKQLTEGA